MQPRRGAWGEAFTLHGRIQIYDDKSTLCKASIFANGDSDIGNTSFARVKLLPGRTNPTQLEVFEVVCGGEECACFCYSENSINNKLLLLTKHHFIGVQQLYPFASPQKVSTPLSGGLFPVIIYISTQFFFFFYCKCYHFQFCFLAHFSLGKLFLCSMDTRAMMIASLRLRQRGAGCWRWLKRNAIFIWGWICYYPSCSWLKWKIKHNRGEAKVYPCLLL